MGEEGEARSQRRLLSNKKGFFFPLVLLPRRDAGVKNSAGSGRQGLQEEINEEEEQRREVQ